MKKKRGIFSRSDLFFTICLFTEKPITIENGTFAWGHDEEDGKPVLHNVDMEIEEGSLVAVVGSVGAGKSSLCSAILGEMEKQSGRVNVNVRLTEWKSRSNKAWKGCAFFLPLPLVFL